MKNKEVPSETIWRNAYKNAQIEIGKLKSENDELRYKLNQKEKAIREFKKWQGRVATYKWRYWLTEGLKLADEQPDKETYNAIVDYFSGMESYTRKLNHLKNSYRKAFVAKTILKGGETP